MSHTLAPEVVTGLQNFIFWWYQQYGRTHLPWRQTTDPYRILVSELMLQQTQVDRVVPKYEAFLGQFPTLQSLANAHLGQVLGSWQGLGYNRRAQHLHQTARQVVEQGGQLPNNSVELCKLPGIGPYTSQAIVAFAYDQPVTLIETNVRAVFLYHFFHGREKVSDAEILPLISAAVPPHSARIWYAALMDYGAHLKRAVPNPSRQSKHHTRQSRFVGSARQVRGAVIRALSAAREGLGEQVLLENVELDLGRSLDVGQFNKILESLVEQRMIQVSADHDEALYSL